MYAYAGAYMGICVHWVYQATNIEISPSLVRDNKSSAIRVVKGMARENERQSREEKKNPQIARDSKIYLDYNSALRNFLHLFQ